MYYNDALVLSGVPFNVSEQHNGGSLPGIILLTQCYYLPSGNSFKCHEEVLYLQPMISPKRLDIFSPLTEGCPEGLDAIRLFL